MIDFFSLAGFELGLSDPEAPDLPISQAAPLKKKQIILRNVFVVCY